jgi:hypothetical protein
MGCSIEPWIGARKNFSGNGKKSRFDRFRALNNDAVDRFMEYMRVNFDDLANNLAIFNK